MILNKRAIMTLYDYLIKIYMYKLILIEYMCVITVLMGDSYSSEGFTITEIFYNKTNKKTKLFLGRGYAHAKN